VKPSKIRDRERDRDEEEETEDEKPSLAFRVGRFLGRGLRAARRQQQRAARSLRRNRNRN